MSDPVLRSFLAVASQDAARIGAESDILRLVGEPRSGMPPSLYLGLLRDVEHLVRRSDGTIGVSREPISFVVRFADDYLRSTDPNLGLRTLHVLSPLFHPNVGRGHICLGSGFRPGTRLRPLVEQAYGVFSCRVAATHDALDPEASDYFRRHPEQVGRLRARPLWREPVAGRIRVERAPSRQRTQEDPA